MAQPGVVAAVTVSVLVTKYFLTVPCLRRRAPHHCGDLEPSQQLGRRLWFSQLPPGCQRFWKVSKHGAFSLPRQALGLRPSDQSCHHETWLHLHFVDWSNKWNHQGHYNGNVRLKERPGSSGNRAQKRHVSDLLSDHSLSS